MSALSVSGAGIVRVTVLQVETSCELQAGKATGESYLLLTMIGAPVTLAMTYTAHQSIQSMSAG